MSFGEEIIAVNHLETLCATEFQDVVLEFVLDTESAFILIAANVIKGLVEGGEEKSVKLDLHQNAVINVQMIRMFVLVTESV